MQKFTVASFAVGPSICIGFASCVFSEVGELLVSLALLLSQLKSIKAQLKMNTLIRW